MNLDLPIIMHNQIFRVWVLILATMLAIMPLDNAQACDGNTMDFVSLIDNGDGTYTISIEVCLALDVNWGGTDDFNLTMAGGTYSSISSIQTSTFTTSYLYCAAGCATCFMCSGCADGNPPITGGGSASVGASMGGITVSASGGNNIAPDDLSTFCINQAVETCGIITFTTNGYPGTITMEGTENDFCGPTDNNLNCQQSSGGCPTTVTVPPPSNPPPCTPPTASFNYNGDQCLNGNSFDFTNTGSSGTTMGQPNFTYDWTFPNGNPSTSTDENPSNVVFSTSGTFTVDFTVCEVDDPTCCATISQTITVFPDPSVNITGTDESCNGLCDGSASTSVSSGTSPYNYSWNTSPVQTGSTATGLCAGTYMVTVTDDNGCIATASVTINPGPAPNAGFTFTGSGCLSNNSFDFTNTGSPGGMNGATFSWDFGDGSNTSTDENPSGISYASCGTFVVTQTVIEDGCSATVSQPVTVFCDPIASIVGVDESCAGACDGSANLTVTNGTSPYTYDWSNGDNNQDPAGLCAGNYTVTVTDANGCTTTASVTINSGPAVVAGFTYNGNQCLTGNSFNFTNTGTTAMNGATFSWDFGDGSGTSTAENPSYTYGSSGTFTVTQTVTVGACSAQATFVIEVYDEPIISIVGVDESCPGACDGSANLTASGGNPAYTYDWSSGESTQDLSNLCAGTYDVTVTDNNGCIGIGSVIIGSGTGVVAGFTVNPLSACLSGNSFNFTNTGTPQSMGSPSISWDFGDGSGTSTQENPSYTYTSSGTFTITQTIDDGNCSDIATQTITIFDEPVATISSTNLNCNGVCDGTINLTPSGGTSPYTFNWSNLATTEDLSGGCFS